MVFPYAKLLRLSPVRRFPEISRVAYVRQLPLWWMWSPNSATPKPGGAHGAPNHGGLPGVPVTGTSGVAKEPQKGKSRGRSAAASKNGEKLKEVFMFFLFSFNLPTLGPLDLS